MSKSSCRELLDYVGHGGDPEELAARVERVLALHRHDGEEMTERRFYATYHDALEDVMRLLNGEAP